MYWRMFQRQTVIIEIVIVSPSEIEFSDLEDLRDLMRGMFSGVIVATLARTVAVVGQFADSEFHRARGPFYEIG